MEVIGLFIFNVLFSAAATKKTCEGNFFTEDSSFRSVVKTPAYVDKTLLLDRLFSGGIGRNMIVAPNGCGKSTNLDMVRSFASIPVDGSGDRIEPNATEAHGIFNSLKVHNKTSFFYKHFGQYPVVYFDFRCDGPLKTKADAYDIVRRKYHAIFKQHEYLVKSARLDEDERGMCELWCGEKSFRKIYDSAVTTGLEELIEFLYLHYNETKVLVLVDDYDGVISEAKSKLSEADSKHVVVLMLGELSKVLKSNDRVAGALLTGVMSGAKKSGYHGVDKVYMHEFLDDETEDHLVDFYGFTQAEVEHVLADPRFGLDGATIAEQMERLNSECFTSRKGRRIYRPRTVLNVLQKATGKTH